MSQSSPRNSSNTNSSEVRQNDIYNQQQHPQDIPQPNSSIHSQLLPPPPPPQQQVPFNQALNINNPNNFNSYSTTTNFGNSPSFEQPRFFPLQQQQHHLQFQGHHPLHIPQPVFNQPPLPLATGPNQQFQSHQAINARPFVQNEQFQNVPNVSSDILPAGATLPEKLQRVLPLPPLSKAPVRPDSLQPQIPRRSRRRSKYTKEQDDMIVSMKKGGKSWVDIAEVTGVGSFLAARNRYQVLIGQQGGGSASWGMDDNTTLQDLLDDGELEKWKFIARELQKATGKTFTDKQCREVIRILFWKDPQSFGINDETLQECIKEHNTTIRSIQEQNEQEQYHQSQFIPPQFASETQAIQSNPPEFSSQHQNPSSSSNNQDYLAYYNQQQFPNQSQNQQFQSNDHTFHPLAPLNFSQNHPSSNDKKSGSF